MRERLLLVDVRDGEAHVDQHPVAELDAVWAAGHERDVDDATYACHVDAGQESLRIAELDDLPWDRSAHAPNYSQPTKSATAALAERIERPGQWLAQLGPDRRAAGLRRRGARVAMATPRLAEPLPRRSRKPTSCGLR